MFYQWFQVVASIVLLIEGVIAIAECITKKDSRVFVLIFIISVLIVGCVFLLTKFFPISEPAVEPSTTEELIEEELIEEELTEKESTEKDKRDDSEFIPDYIPGNQAIKENSIYKNNGGCLAVQDKKIYIATRDSILKMDSDYSNVEKVLDVEAYDLNVLGDWIYYSTMDGIYRVRTDGKENVRIVEVLGGVLDMVVYDNGIYYIKDSDAKLYFVCCDGTKEQCLIEDTMHKFCLMDWSIFYTQVERQYNDDGKWRSATATGLYNVNYNGESVLVVTNQMDEWGVRIHDVPWDLCKYGYDIIYCNAFGLFRLEAYTNSITELTDIGGISVCVVDEWAYYAGIEQSEQYDYVGHIIRVNLESGEIEDMGKPFQESTQITYLYPVGSDVILTLDREIWYKYSDGILEELSELRDY